MNRAIVEQFRRHDDDAGTTLVYEENADLGLAVQAVEPGAGWDVAESRLLVRHNIDDEGITVVRLDRNGGGGNAADAAVLTEIIAALEEVRDTLASYAGGVA
jgi:hypothetical protein